MESESGGEEPEAESAQAPVQRGEQEEEDRLEPRPEMERGDEGVQHGDRGVRQAWGEGTQHRGDEAQRLVAQEERKEEEHAQTAESERHEERCLARRRSVVAAHG